MPFALALNVDEDVIKVHYYQNVKFFCQDLINIGLDRNWCISQLQRYDLLLKVAIVGFEGHFLFVSFLNLHLTIGIGQIKLDKPLSLTWSIQ